MGRGKSGDFRRRKTGTRRQKGKVFRIKPYPRTEARQRAIQNTLLKGRVRRTSFPMVSVVRIHRAEGWSNDPELRKWLEFRTIEEGNAKLTKNAKGMDPSQLGYDKHDFEVKFKDGTSYKGRYDLKYNEKGNLSKQMTEFMQFILNAPEKHPTTPYAEMSKKERNEALKILKNLGAKPLPKGVCKCYYCNTLRKQIHRESIGHYGGTFVEVPEEFFQAFKSRFPGREFPKKPKKKNVGDLNFGFDYEKDFHKKYPQSHGDYYDIYFADRSKGHKRLEDMMDKERRDSGAKWYR